MTDHDTVSPPTGASSPHQCKRHGRRALAIVGVALAAGLIGAYATSSFGQGFGPPFGRGFGPGWGGGPFASETVDPALIDARLNRMVRHLAVELDANAEQQQKLQTILSAAVKDLLPVREKMSTARRQARDLLTQASIDRSAIEKLRADQIATADAASKRLVQALADAADVLTPDQRRKLDELLPVGGGRGPGWGMGWRGMGGHGMGGWWGGGPRN